MKKIYYWINAFFSIIVFNKDLEKHGLTKMFKEYAVKFGSIPYIDYRVFAEKEILARTGEMNSWINAAISACRFLPFEAKCIHQSFYIFKLVRKRYGMPVSLVIGTCPFPFSAHAWIMAGKENFFEEDYETSKYDIILRSEDFYEMG